MTADELASRQRKAMSLSVTVVEDGYSVPSSDGGEYIVSYADDGRLVCKCVDFVIHKADQIGNVNTSLQSCFSCKGTVYPVHHQQNQLKRMYQGMTSLIWVRHKKAR